MKTNGMENSLRNTIYHWMRSHKSSMVTKEPLTYLKKAQVKTYSINTVHVFIS